LIPPRKHTQHAIQYETLSELFAVTGHASVETTQIYIALDTAELQDAHEKHTPVHDIIDLSDKTE